MLNMPKTLRYAGIGSRKTPADVLLQMHAIAEQLAERWLLRSGHAEGADKAFEDGAIAGGGTKEIFIPWFGFNKAPSGHADYIRPTTTQGLADYTAKFHPAWAKCTDAAKLLHMRNTCQILGENGDAPVHMVICWTPLGLRVGGTGQALRVAADHNIPIFDLGLPNDSVQQELVDFVADMEK